LAGLVMIAGVVSPRSHAPVDTGTSDAYVAVVVRIAGLGALMRVGAALASSAVIDWRASIAVIAAVSVIVASLVALGQTSPRRILAYASIAQAGYAAVALTAGFASGPTAAFFLAAFALMTVGALGGGVPAEPVRMARGRRRRAAARPGLCHRAGRSGRCSARRPRSRTAARYRAERAFLGSRGAGRNRTGDTSLRTALLYPLSYSPRATQLSVDGCHSCHRASTVS